MLNCDKCEQIRYTGAGSHNNTVAESALQTPHVNSRYSTNMHAFRFKCNMFTYGVPRIL